METKMIKVGDREIVTYGDKDLSVGNENRHYMWCGYHEQRRCYGVCTSLLESFQAGRLQGADVDQTCANAMKRGRCAAEPMRQLEVRLNASIFYKKRIGTADRPHREDMGWEGNSATFGRSFRDSRDSAFMAGWDRVGASLKRQNDDIPIKKATSVERAPIQPSTPTLADAISKKVAELGS